MNAKDEHAPTTIYEKRAYLAEHFKYVLPPSCLKTEAVVDAMMDCCRVQQKMQKAIDAYQIQRHHINITELAKSWQPLYQESLAILKKYNNVDAEWFIERMLNHHKRKNIFFDVVRKSGEKQLIIQRFSDWVICKDPVLSLRNTISELLALSQSDPHYEGNFSTYNHLIEFYFFETVF